MKIQSCKPLRKRDISRFPNLAKAALIQFMEPPYQEEAVMHVNQIQAWSIDPAIYGKEIVLCRPAVAVGSELSPGSVSNYQKARSAFDQMAFGNMSKKTERGTLKKSDPNKGERLDCEFFYKNEVNHRQFGKEPWKAVDWLMKNQGALGKDIPAEYRRHLIWDARKGNGVEIK